LTSWFKVWCNYHTA